jgi:hypothetical protein
MKKILLTLLLASSIVLCASAQVNLLKNGDMEEQGAWGIAQGNLLDTIWYEFGSTENTVNGGKGGNLVMKQSPVDSTVDNITIFQALDLVGGEEYQWHCAMRDLSDHGDCWWIKYVWVGLEPWDGEDPDEEDIAFMHPWMGGGERTIWGFNGLFDTCTNSIAAASRDNIFIPEVDGTYYVGINFGTCYDTGDYHFIIDEVAMIDQDSVASAINQFADNGTSLTVYPNPAKTIIHFACSINEYSDVELRLFNILGQEVATITKQSDYKGTFKESFDCSNLADGMYYGILKANNTIIKQKIIILK